MAMNQKLQKELLQQMSRLREGEQKRVLALAKRLAQEDQHKHRYKEVKVKSWEQLLCYSEGCDLNIPGVKKWNRWIFKGHSCDEWTLSTTIERTLHDRFRLDLSVAWKWERRLSREFMRKARGFLKDPPSDIDYMEWLALMQHYGAPTRLHDWTYSFWAAVLFAVEQANVNENNNEEKFCAVWALEIDWLRKRVEENIPKLKELVNEGTDPNAEIGFILNSQKKNNTPLGVRPLNAYRLNQRVIAQQALFVVPLDVTKPFMENLCRCPTVEGMISQHLIKFVIPCSDETIRGCVKYLYDRNLTRAMLFPGIEGYADSIGNLVLLPHRFHGVGGDPNRPWPN
ncbi:MAG: FRG domain-containing protein [Nitrospira sp.]